MEDKIKQEIIIDEACAKEINRTFSQAKNYSVIYILWFLFSIFRYFIKYFKNDFHSINDLNSFFSFIILPIFMVLQFVFGLLGIYFFFKAFFIQRKSIEIDDGKIFANSYVYFRKGNRMSLLNAILLILSFGFLTYLENK